MSNIIRVEDTDGLLKNKLIDKLQNAAHMVIGELDKPSTYEVVLNQVIMYLQDQDRIKHWNKIKDIKRK